MKQLSADTMLPSREGPVLGGLQPRSGAEQIDIGALDELVVAAGRSRWAKRLAEITARASLGRTGRAVQQRHAIELTIERLRGRPNRPPSLAERRIGALAAYLMAEKDRLTAAGRARLRARLAAAMTEDDTLVPLFHLAGCIERQRARDFDVGAVGLEEDAPFDLLLSRKGTEAELVCDVVSAEGGRGVHRSAWFSLTDRIDPDLQTWLAAHPGRYLLKMTLPQGLEARDTQALGTLHGRIRTMLDAQLRSDQSSAAVLRLDPLVLAAAQADELGLLSSLRQHFGREAHLSVTASGQALFVMAARAVQADDVPAAMRRRMSAVAPARLTGTRPGILAMFVEDVDRAEWRGLRAELQLEREARQFLTLPEASSVVAVTCLSRFELFGLAEPDAAAEDELRFRNPSHPAAKTPALAAAIQSSV